MTEIVDEDDRPWNAQARAKVAAADVKVGDKVRELVAADELGRYGTLASIDRSDPENTFGVELEEGFRWLSNVRGEPKETPAVDALSLGEARVSLNASHAANDALTARVETLNEKVAQLETQLRAAQGRASAAYGSSGGRCRRRRTRSSTTVRCRAGAGWSSG
jgi:outer membrane murein-binding lipoprotein Lpp